MQGACGAHAGKGTFREHAGKGTFRERNLQDMKHSGSIEETFREHSWSIGSVQGTCREHAAF
jgi:hypothetical protein